MSNITRAITEMGSIVVSVIDSTDICNEFEKIHNTSAVVTAAMGRLITGTSLMGIMQKDNDDTITVRINANGMIGDMIAVSDSFGNVRGYCTNKVIEIPLNEKGKLDVGTAVGKGILSVVRSTKLGNFTGQVELVTSEIAEDLTSYYAVSEQIPTCISLGVLVNTDLTVKKAGGFLLQLLPFTSEEEINKIEKNINNLSSMTQMMENGLNNYDIIKLIFDGFEYNILDEFNVKYKCDCSYERVERGLKSLPKEDKLDLMKDACIDINCEFCENTYKFTSEDIKKLM